MRFDASIRPWTAFAGEGGRHPAMSPSPPPFTDTATAKALNPPSIANYEKHKSWLDRLRDLRSIDSDVRDRFILAVEAAEASGELPGMAGDVPRMLQRYAHDSSLRGTDDELALQADAESLPRAGMLGAPDEANLLCLLLELMDARTVVEVGVFRGTTTLALALCLQRLEDQSGEGGGGGGGAKDKDGRGRRRVIGLDASEEYAEVGRRYWERAGVDGLIDFRVGDAGESLERMLDEEGLGEGSVDLCFVDADKTGYDDYYEKCLRLTKKGGLIVVDNTIWGGRVIIPNDILDILGSASTEEGSPLANDAEFAQSTRCIKALTEKISKDNRVERVCFLTIADGVIICRKK